MRSSLIEEGAGKEPTAKIGVKQYATQRCDYFSDFIPDVKRARKAVDGWRLGGGYCMICCRNSRTACRLQGFCRFKRLHFLGE
jgi:hypothetical protein